jgi:hypothetical protein
MNSLVELFVRRFWRVDRCRMDVCLKPLFEKAMSRLRKGGYSLLPPNGRREAETSNRSMGLSENILLVAFVF